jgi:hypothetical protein
MPHSPNGRAIALSDPLQAHFAALRGRHCTPSTAWPPYSSGRRPAL